MADQSYVFDNAWKRGRDRLDEVEAFLDPGTIRALEDLGVAQLAGTDEPAAHLLHRELEPPRAGRAALHDEDAALVADLDQPGVAQRPRQVAAVIRLQPGKLSDTEVDRMLGLFADPEWAALSPIRWRRANSTSSTRASSSSTSRNATRL